MSQTAKPTQGPWEIVRLLPDLINIRGRDGNPIPGLGGIAACPANSEAEANAKLAVAAWCMKEALEAFVTWCERPNAEIGGCRRIDTEHSTGGFAAYNKAVRALARVSE